MTDLATRYGRRERPRWLWPVVAAVGIGLGVAYAAWIAFQPKAVHGVLFGFEVTGNDSIVLTVELKRTEQVPVTCTVYAQSQDHAIVGEREVVLQPTGAEKVREEITVQTTARPVTGVLRSCRATP